MAVSCHDMIRLFASFSLIMFLQVPQGCVSKNSDPPRPVAIVWKDDQATALSIPLSYVDHLDSDSIELLKVRLSDAKISTDILGQYALVDDNIVFQPLIPFTRGLRYEVVYHHDRVTEIIIAEPADRPEILSFYPSIDTLPLNLLKIYIQFSRPMREGTSLAHLTVLEDKDTAKGIFLDLQPELWNAEGTLLTLWLDPGRIKRDLQPNKLLGNPLRQGKHYALQVSKDWTDTRGAYLPRDYTKEFVVTERDSLSPDPHTWKIETTKVGSNLACVIDFPEALDFSLLHHAIHIINEKGFVLEGTIDLLNKERTWKFLPAEPWTTGKYSVQVETRLEDVAGNNLNRTFEKDLKAKEKSTSN